MTAHQKWCGWLPLKPEAGSSSKESCYCSYAKENCAIGGVSYAIETGKAFLKGLETSVEEGVKQVCRYLNGRILSRGPVENFSIETTGGFDVGYVQLTDVNLLSGMNMPQLKRTENVLQLSLILL